VLLPAPQRVLIEWPERVERLRTGPGAAAHSLHPARAAPGWAWPWR